MYTLSKSDTQQTKYKNLNEPYQNATKLVNSCPTEATRKKGNVLKNKMYA